MSSSSIEEFNQSPVEMQQEIVSSYLSNAKNEDEKAQLRNVQNLLKYLKENQDQKSENEKTPISPFQKNLNYSKENQNEDQDQNNENIEALISRFQNLLKCFEEKQEDDHEGEHLFSITNQNKEKKLSEVIFQINEIELSYQATEILQAKNRLQSIDFEQQLKNFNSFFYNFNWRFCFR